MTRSSSFRTPLVFLRNTWMVCGMTVILIVALELSLNLAFLVKDTILSPRDNVCSDPRSKADAYGKAGWVDDYYSEYCASYNTEWKSYVYWHRKPFKGQYINIDAEGHRRTVQPPPRLSSEEGRAPRIFMFGGSTLWGTGSRDSYTIPSLVSRRLWEKGRPAEITNFGESGYVSTQEVLVLLQQLRDGNVPDYVIFYDGTNDVFSAYQGGKPGIPQNEFNREIEFNITQSGNYERMFSLAVHSATRKLSVFRAARSVIPVTAGLDNGARNQKASTYTAAALDNLETRLIDVYLGNMKIISELGKSFGFGAVFYWQPTIFGKKNLSPWEQSAYSSKAYLENFFVETNRRLEERGLVGGHEEFRSLWDIFADVTRPVYLDWCHVSEQGNEVIAERIAADISTLLEGRAETDSGSGGTL